MNQTFTIREINADGTISILHQEEVPFAPLDGANVAVVLMVCKGLITLEEAVNITHLPVEHLVNEAQAWAIAEAAND